MRRLVVGGRSGSAPTVRCRSGFARGLPERTVAAAPTVPCAWVLRRAWVAVAHLGCNKVAHGWNGRGCRRGVGVRGVPTVACRVKRGAFGRVLGLGSLVVAMVVRVSRAGVAVVAAWWVWAMQGLRCGAAACAHSVGRCEVERAGARPFQQGLCNGQEATDGEQSTAGRSCASFGWCV